MTSVNTLFSWPLLWASCHTKEQRRHRRWHSPRINCRTLTATVLTAIATVTLSLRACLCFLLSHLLSQVHRRQKQLSDFVEPRTGGPREASLCTRRGSRKTVWCHALRVVEPVYHQALLCGRWRSRRSQRSSARRGGPLEVRFVISQDSLLCPSCGKRFLS